VARHTYLTPALRARCEAWGARYLPLAKLARTEHMAHLHLKLRTLRAVAQRLGVSAQLVHYRLAEREWVLRGEAQRLAGLDLSGLTEEPHEW